MGRKKIIRCFIVHAFTDKNDGDDLLTFYQMHGKASMLIVLNCYCYYLTLVYSCDVC